MNINHTEKRIYNRIATERGSFVYNPALGSLLYRLQRAKNLQEVVDLACEYIKDALRAEFENGTIKRLGELRVLARVGNRVKLEIDIFLSNDYKMTLPFEV